MGKNKLVDFLLEGTKNKTLKWVFRNDYFLAHLTLARNGIILNLRIRKNGDAVTLFAEIDGNTVLLTGIDRHNLYQLGVVVQQSQVVDENTEAIISEVLSKFLGI